MLWKSSSVRRESILSPLILGILLGGLFLAPEAIKSFSYGTF
jgi:hypothetical protein